MPKSKERKGKRLSPVRASKHQLYLGLNAGEIEVGASCFIQRHMKLLALAPSSLGHSLDFTCYRGPSSLMMLHSRQDPSQPIPASLGS